MTHYSSISRALFFGLVQLLATVVYGAEITFEKIPTATEGALSNLSTSTANMQFRSTSQGSRWVGFGFESVQNASLEKVILLIHNQLVSSQALNAKITVSIVQLETLKGVPASMGKALYSESATTPAQYGNEDGFSIHFSKPFPLDKGSYYGIVLSFDEEGTSRSINFTQGGVAGQNHIGSAFYSSDGGVTYETKMPFNFVLQFSQK